MVEIYKNSEKKTTTAVITGGSEDAQNYISKRFGVNRFCEHLSRAELSDKYTGTVKLDERDEYDESAGEAEAINKVTHNYKKSFKKAIVRWQVAMLRDIKAVNPDTFNEALSKIK